MGTGFQTSHLRATGICRRCPPLATLLLELFFRVKEKRKEKNSNIDKL